MNSLTDAGLNTGKRVVGWCLAGAACVFALTGGFGLLVPGIEGLHNCAGYMTDRYLFVGGALAGCCYLWVWRLLWAPAKRVVTAVLMVLILAVAVNVALRQDPLAAWTNWKLVVVKCEGVEEYFEYIDNHESLYYDALTGTAFAMQGS